MVICSCKSTATSCRCGRMIGREKWKDLVVTNLRYCPVTLHLFALTYGHEVKEL